MPAKPLLRCVDGRGRAELIRMMLAIGRTEFEEKNIKTKEDLAEVQSELLFGQIPSLSIDGKVLVQPGCIVRHLARKFDLFGEDDDETTRIDMLFEGTRDCIGKFYAFAFANDVRVKEEIDTKILPKYFPVFNKLLQENRTGYLVGSDLSLADVGFLEVILSVVDYFGEERFADADCSNIKKFYEKMKGKSEISKYIKKIRKRMNDEDYVKEVKELIS